MILNMNDNGKRYSIYTFGDTSGRVYSVKASVAFLVSTDDYVADHRIDQEAVEAGVANFEEVLPTDNDFAKIITHMFVRQPVTAESGPWHPLFDTLSRYLGHDKWIATDLSQAVREARHQRDDSGLLNRFFKVSLDLKNDAGEIERVDVASVMFS